MTATAAPAIPADLMFEGHAIVSADGMIADGDGATPPGLRSDADWELFQAALNRAVLVVLGRPAHALHPNAGRRRLVLTRSVTGLVPDPGDADAQFWNPADKSLPATLAALGVTRGTVAVAGVFDYFAPYFDSFSLAECHGLVLPGGIPCFAAGHPRSVLAGIGLVPGPLRMIDAAAGVSLTQWQRVPSPLRGEGGA